MSAFGGPNIVDNGLVTLLDVANIKSFKGEPTVNIAAENIGFSNMTQGGISYSFVGIEDGWRKYAITGTGNSNTYPYTFNILLSTILVSTRTSFSFKYKTNVESKYVSFGDPRMVNIFYAVGRTTTNIQENDYRIGKLENVSPASGTEIQSQPIYFLSRPIEGTVFNPSTDFLYFKDVQAERLPYATPFVNGTRGSTVATGGGLFDMTYNTTNGQLFGTTYDSNNLGSLDFDGTDDYYTITQPAITTSPNSWTISLWMNPGNQSSRFITPQSNGIDQYLIYNPTNQGVQIRVATSADTNERTRSMSVNTVPLNKWTFLTISLDNLTIKMYSNGILRNTFTETLSIANWTANWVVGQRGNATNWYLGKMSNLMVYDRVLSDDEVLQNYNSTKGRFGL